ncbi:MAG: hypothetical protein CBE26_02000 [Kiritimatiellaceae bacterium TMED266]|nr:MAG: hypothetical protein CBE26_02000 [Kiritimatiellaceae bacterium TMED266]
MSISVDLVLEAINEIGEERESSLLTEASETTLLIGDEGGLDSLSIVNLTVDLEERVFEETGVDIVIADDSTMSMRTTPFRSAKKLTDHINKLLNAAS